MTETKRSVGEIMNDIMRVCADIEHQAQKIQGRDERSDDTQDRAPYELRLQIGKALDSLICDESTPDQVDKFIRTFAEFGLSIFFTTHDADGHFRAEIDDTPPPTHG